MLKLCESPLGRTIATTTCLVGGNYGCARVSLPLGNAGGAERAAGANGIAERLAGVRDEAGCASVVCPQAIAAGA